MKTVWLLLLASGSAAPIELEGEIYSRTSAIVTPPSIPDMWRFTIIRLTPDGSSVKRGQVVVELDSSELTKRLREKQSALKEKQSQHKKLLLELAERERAEYLATEKSRSDYDKTRRKATQPAALIARRDYSKLVIERTQAERGLALAERRELLAAEQRRQERRQIEVAIVRLEGEVSLIHTSLAALQVVAPRGGVLQHRNNFQGDKPDVGSQVWRGLTIAEIPDPKQFGVHAVLPERDLLKISNADGALVHLTDGVGSTIHGRVIDIGRVVRSKSRIQPVPVLDIVIELVSGNYRLKSGQAVRVEITTTRKEN